MSLVLVCPPVIVVERMCFLTILIINYNSFKALTDLGFNYQTRHQPYHSSHEEHYS